jgi:uncharacterized membrane protein YidH (DUF202 family)
MNFIQSNFNNRELAIIIWMTVIILWLCTKKDVVKSFGRVIKTFFATKIFLSVLGMAVYVLLAVFFLYKLRFWDMSLLKDTLVWFLGGGFVIHLSVNKINNDERFFRRFIVDNLKVILAIEFIVNFYSFSLLVELILVPVLLLTVGSKAFAETHHEYKDNEKYKPALKMLNGILSIVGFSFLIYFLYKLGQDFKGFSNSKTVRGFFLPMFLSLSALPMMYVMGLLMLYESLFIQLSFRIRENKKLVRYLNWHVFKVCNFHILRVKNFGKGFSSFGIKDEADVDYAIKRALVILRRKKYLKSR